jgi:hypothetical protein
LKAIQEKISSYEFKDCKVRVSNVDSQESADNGIVIQVLGEMSNNGLPNRKFSQTFFLAEQPNGYYVLNDIFRYLKDDEDTESGDLEEIADEAVAEAVVEAVAEAITEAVEVAADEVVEAIEDLSLKETTTTEVDVQENKVVIEETTTVEPALPIPEPQGLPPPVNGDGQAEDGSPSAEGSVIESEPKHEPEPEPESKVEETPPPVTPPPVEIATPFVEEKKLASIPVRESERTPVATPAPAVPPKPVTYASIAKSGPPAYTAQSSIIAPTTPPTPQTLQTQPQTQPQATPVATSTTTASTATSTPMTPGGGPQWQTTESKRHSRPASISGTTTTGQAAYVKNVSEGVSNQALKDALTKFGPLKSFEISRQKVVISLQKRVIWLIDSM